MFVVTEDDAAAIRAVYEQRGEFAAAIRQRAGTGVRSCNRRLEATAAATGPHVSEKLPPK
jgi:hypothetical protein